MTLQPELIDLLQRAYSAERAAAFAYQGHAGAVRDPEEKQAIRQIEIDEWNHRAEVWQIMQLYAVPVSQWEEFHFYVIGKAISVACYVIGWFMPHYFAGRLESGNVCEYFRMMRLFHDLGIREHDQVLFDMGVREKAHEDYFLGRIAGSNLLPLFEWVFRWGRKSLNEVDLANLLPVERSDTYCQSVTPHSDA